MARGVRRPGARPVRDDRACATSCAWPGCPPTGSASRSSWPAPSAPSAPRSRSSGSSRRSCAGEILFALGYTEPDSGSDVAAAKTRAVRDGDDWVIDGQKMFTTLAHEAAYVFLLTRTDPDVPKHQGLTMFLVPARRARRGDPPGAHDGRRAHQRHLLHGRARARRVPGGRGRRRLGRDERRAHVRARRVRAQRGRPRVAVDRRLGHHAPVGPTAPA